MNAERLLEVYEQISEAPDAIARLRTFVLNLAVRGKVGTGSLTESPLENYEANPEWEWLPENWRVLNFGRHCDIQGGNQPPKSQFSSEPRDGYVRLFQIRDLGSNPVPVYIPESSTKRFCKEGEILIGRYGASVGKIFWAQSGAYNVALAKFIWPEDALTPEFCFLLLKSDLFQTCLEGASRSAQAGFNKGDLAAVNLPLPPLAEQHRIVAKVDELMALCDRLEQARKMREEVRDKLTAASLARLTAPDTTPEDFPTHAAFALEALPALTTRPDQINILRQTILNLAVRGKLVEQDPADEPASGLVKRIAMKRAELVRTGDAKKLKPRNDEAWPFAIPGSWSWCALGEVSSLVTKGSSPKWQGVGYVDKDAGLLFITSENVGNFTLRKLDELKYVEARFKEIEPRSMLRRGDILINLVGASIGRSAIYDLDEEANINQAVALVRMTDPEDRPSLEYLLKYLNSDVAVDLMLGSRVTTAQPNISLADVAGFPVPFPPLAEQHRIVAKVDALMALCDQLEAALTTADTTRTRLLEALLHEALEPATDSLEAAE